MVKNLIMNPSRLADMASPELYSSSILVLLLAFNSHSLFFLPLRGCWWWVDGQESSKEEISGLIWAVVLYGYIEKQASACFLHLFMLIKNDDDDDDDDDEDDDDDDDDDDNDGFFLCPGI